MDLSVEDAGAPRQPFPACESGSRRDRSRAQGERCRAGPQLPFAFSGPASNTQHGPPPGLCWGSERGCDPQPEGEPLNAGLAEPLETRGRMAGGEVRAWALKAGPGDLSVTWHPHRRPSSSSCSSGTAFGPITDTHRTRPSSFRAKGSLRKPARETRGEPRPSRPQGMKRSQRPPGWTCPDSHAGSQCHPGVLGKALLS